MTLLAAAICSSAGRSIASTVPNSTRTTSTLLPRQATSNDAEREGHQIERHQSRIASCPARRRTGRPAPPPQARSPARRATARSATAPHRENRSPPRASPRAPARRHRGSSGAAPAACRPRRWPAPARARYQRRAHERRASRTARQQRVRRASCRHRGQRRVGRTPGEAAARQHQGEGKRVRTRSRSCSTAMTVRPSSCQRVTWSSKAAVVAASTAANGSSRRMTAASCSSSRANSARCNSPTESSATLRCSAPASPTASAAATARARSARLRPGKRRTAASRRGDQLRHAQRPVAIERRQLRQKCQTMPPRGWALDGAAGKPREAADRRQQRALAGAVGADHCGQAAGRELAADRFQRHPPPVAHGHLPQVRRGRLARRPAHDFIPDGYVGPKRAVRQAIAKAHPMRHTTRTCRRRRRRGNKNGRSDHEKRRTMPRSWRMLVLALLSNRRPPRPGRLQGGCRTVAVRAE